MASLYRQPKSSYYWVKWKDPATGKICRESTGIRHDSPSAKTRARGVVFEKARLESQAPRSNTTRKHRWQEWVPAFLAERYATSPKTLSRAKNSWAAWSLYLEGQKVATPRHLTYQIASEYAHWRTGGGTGRVAHHNTAILETKFMGVIMREAVRRGIAAGNVIRELEMKRVDAKQKLEITAEHQAVIEHAITTGDIARDEPWMADHWTVLMKTGCRCIEACVAIADLNLIDLIMPLRIKGGDIHRVPMHPDVVALAKRRKEAGEKWLIDPRPNMSRRWWRFFQTINLPYSIHCTRVTVITRLFRAGRTIAQVCQLVGHSEEVNVIYRRLNANDVRHLLSDL